MDTIKMNVTPLCSEAVHNTYGGDNLSESVFRAAGYTWQRLKNFGENIGDFMTGASYPMM